jgi:hypothetical protein
MLAVVAPVFHEYVYGAVPPVADTVAVPSADPKHVASVLLQVGSNGADGPPTVALHVVEHPLASVTVTLYVPALRPLMPAVVAPVFHR